ncbi:hypothetical protein BDV97DRAFT_295055 [Delphinella strobiligena]|nr:hypothetical protein BDV97DRAFT_295055 [Delphinella strobiligena]
MQKLIQRTSAAQRQAARRAARQSGKRENAKEYQSRQQHKAHNAALTMYIKSERERRREIYEAGKLAPRYDAGENVRNYATVDPYVLQGVNRSWNEYKDDVCPFEEGDRVVVTHGRDQGKISRISTLDIQAGHVKIAGLNQGDWFVPEHARIEDSDPRPIVATSLPIPISNIKLVHVLRNPETGVFQDTILDKIIVRGGGFNKITREYKRGRRFVPGLREEIPWPKKEDKPEEETHDDDTFRINVDERTHRPYLLQPPMPPSVIDELRNKYSVFRDRHEDWYEARKLAEDRAQEQKKLLARMVSTPMMELREKKRQEKLTNDSDLSEDQLAKIGQVMAKERLNAARKVAHAQQ